MYQSEFEALSNHVFGLPPRALHNCYLSELKPEIHRELQILKSNSVTEAMGLTRLIEDKLTLATIFSPPMRSYNRTQTPITAPQALLSSTPSATPESTIATRSPFPLQPKPGIRPSYSSPNPNPNPLPFHHLTRAEVQQPKAKGLCLIAFDLDPPPSHSPDPLIDLLTPPEHDSNLFTMTLSSFWFV